MQGLIEDCRRKEIYKENPQNLVDVFLEKIESESKDPDTSFTGKIISLQRTRSN